MPPEKTHSQPELETLRSEIERLRHELEAQREELDRELVRRAFRIGQLEAALHRGTQFEATLSWRITRPIRAAKPLVKKLIQREQLMPRPIRNLERRLRQLHFAVVAKLRETLPPWAIDLLKQLRELVRHARQLRQATPAAQRETALHEVEALGDHPLISVVMPTYETEPRHLREAIYSVTTQEYPDWELVIVDDGSTNAGSTRGSDALGRSR